MSNCKILTYGRYANRFQELVSDITEIELIKAVNKEELAAFLPQVENVAGFNFLKGYDISHLKWIHSFTDGIDSYIPLNLPENLILTKTIGKMPVRIAHYCLSFVSSILFDHKRIYEQQNAQKWDLFKTERFYEQSLILLGTGNLGTEIAKAFKPFVNNIIGVNSTGILKDDPSPFNTLISFKDLEERFEVPQQSIFINTLPSTDKTKDIVNLNLLKRFDKTIYVNVGRGSTTSENDLLEALESGYVRKAILDVFKEEPLPEDHIFWKHPQILVTPHYSGLTSFEDVSLDFYRAFQSVKQQRPNDLWVDLSKGY